jgi:hypothetical protein
MTGDARSSPHFLSGKNMLIQKGFQICLPAGRRFSLAGMTEKGTYTRDCHAGLSGRGDSRRRLAWRIFFMLIPAT